MAMQTQSVSSGLVPYRINVRQFLKMINANIFPEGHHVELLGGILVSIPKSITHNFMVSRLGHRLRPLLPDPWLVSEEKSLRIGRFWRLEPDMAIIRGPDRAYIHRGLARPMPA